MTLTVGVADQFITPPLPLLRLAPSPSGPLSGQGTFTPSGYGLVFSIILEPPNAGLTPGFVTEFEDRVVQFVVQHQLGDGSTITTQVEDFNTDNGVLIYTLALPLQVGYTVGPGFLVDVLEIVI